VELEEFKKINADRRQIKRIEAKKLKKIWEYEASGADAVDLE